MVVSPLGRARPIYFKGFAETLLHPIRNHFPPGKEFFSSLEKLLIPVNSILQLRHEFFESLGMGRLQRRASR